jgi:hypothetical protein
MKRIFLMIGFCMLLIACSDKNDIDNIISEKWEQCGDKSNCIIDFANSMQFQWDTMYFFSGANSLEDINKELGFSYTQWEDIGDRVIFLNKGKIVYHKDWFPTADEPVKGAVFITDLDKLKLTKSEAKFKISKKGKAFYLEKL